MCRIFTSELIRIIRKSVVEPYDTIFYLAGTLHHTAPTVVYVINILLRDKERA